MAKRRRIPRRLWVGLVPLLLVAAFWLSAIAEFGPSLLSVCWLGMTAGLGLTLARGHPRSRQLGLFVAGLHLGLGVLAMVVFEGVHALYLILMLIGALLFVSLTGETVLRFFGLQCLACGSCRTRARGLFYSGVRCRDCGQEWKAGQA